MPLGILGEQWPKQQLKMCSLPPEERIGQHCGLLLLCWAVWAMLAVLPYPHSSGCRSNTSFLWVLQTISCPSASLTITAASSVAGGVMFHRGLCGGRTTKQQRLSAKPDPIANLKHWEGHVTVGTRKSVVLQNSRLLFSLHIIPSWVVKTFKIWLSEKTRSKMG